jgi:D-alanyl-D-alanine carboxypeptidase
MFFVHFDFFKNMKLAKFLSEGICTNLGIPKQLLAARNFQAYNEAICLEVAELSDDGREHLLTTQAADAWRSLSAAAKSDGIALFIVSAFRSIERQTEIIRRKILAGIAIEEILAVSAPPGYSEHHTGRAVDISTPDSPLLEVDFEKTAAFRWLEDHANSFGFYLSFPRGNSNGFQFEPWHWCFKDIASTSGGINV